MILCPGRIRGSGGGISVVTRLVVQGRVPTVLLWSSRGHLGSCLRHVFLASAGVDITLAGVLDIRWSTVVDYNGLSTRITHNEKSHTTGVASQAFLHHSIENRTCFHKRLIHGHKISCRKSYETLYFLHGRENLPRFWEYLSISFTILGRNDMQDLYNSCKYDVSAYRGVEVTVGQTWISSLSAKLSFAGSIVRSIISRRSTLAAWEKTPASCSASRAISAAVGSGRGSCGMETEYTVA